MRYFTNLNSLVEMCLRKLPTSLRWNRWSIENQVVGGTSFKIKKNKSNDKISRMKPSPPKRRFTNQRIQPPKKTSESCFSPWMLLQFFGSALSTSPSPPRLAHSQWMPCSVEDAELGPQRLRKADHLWGGRKDNFPQSSGREIHVARSKAWSQY